MACFSEGIVDKIKKVFSFILAFLVSCANWLTSLFNRISRNYRLVASKMKDDHIKVKQQIQVLFYWCLYTPQLSVV